MNPSKDKGHHRERGFSLAEVTLAIGIAALGLSVVFALMTTSMGNLNASADLSAHHRMFNRIIGEIRSEPWSKVDSFDQTFRFFTAQATHLPDTGKDSLDWVYTARIEVKNDTTGIQASNRNRRIIIKVTHLPDYEAAFADKVRRRSFRTYSTLITSMEK